MIPGTSSVYARLIFRIEPAAHPSSRPSGPMPEGRPLRFSWEASGARQSSLFPVCMPLISKPRLQICCRTLLVSEEPGRRGTGERRANPGWHAITSSVARWQCWRKWSGAHLCVFACLYRSRFGTMKQRGVVFFTFEQRNCTSALISLLNCWIEPDWPAKVCVTNRSVKPDSSGVFLREVAEHKAKSHSPVPS